MQKRFDGWLWVGAFVTAACGGVESPASLAQSSAALSCQTDTDCGVGYACAHFSVRNYCEPTSATSTASKRSSPAAADASHTCQSDAGCAAGEECEGEHDLAYCARHDDEGKEHFEADAGAPRAAEQCRHDGEDCSRSDLCADAGAYADCESGRDHGDGDGEDDRSGSNRGPH